MMRDTLIAVMLSLLLSEVSHAQDITTVTCSPETEVFSIQYIPESDDGQNSLAGFPIQCGIRKARYIVKATRGPYTERRCGSMPTVNISLYRNQTILIADVVFGENCFLGPSLTEVVAIEERGNLKSLKICVAVSQDGSQSKCRVLGSTEIAELRKTPVNQFSMAERLGEQ
jgi:hypothetical protein